MTFIEKFDELKEKYGKIDETKLSENFAVQIEMTDEDCGGIFYVAHMNAPFAIEPYNYYDNTASIVVSSKVLEDILSCKADPMEEFFGGNLKVDGDVGHALMLVELLKKEPEKEEAKKTAAKSSEKTEKTTKKKTAAKSADTEKKTVRRKTTKKAEE